MEYYLDEYLPSFENQDNFQILIADMRYSKSRHFTVFPAEGSVRLNAGIERLISEVRK